MMSWSLKTSSLDGYQQQACCDIIGELHAKNIHNVTDEIFFFLDRQSMKNVCLVSKSWREAMLVALKTISQRGNPHWNAGQLRYWQRCKSHLKNDFQVPVQDPRYDQCLTNSINLMIDHLQDGCWPEQTMTMDYLQYVREDFAEDYWIDTLCRIEISDNFIVAYESPIRLFKCWSRRTLSPISMDQEFQMQNFPSISLDEVKKDFHLCGNDLFYAESSTAKRGGNFAKVDVTKVDLDARSRGIDTGEEFKASFLCVEPPVDYAEMVIDFLRVVDDMILLLFAVYIDGDRVEEDSLTVQWKLERGEMRDVFKCDTLQVPSVDWIFFDEDYLILQLLGSDSDEDDVRCRTYSVHPPKDGSNKVELRWIASFELPSPESTDYKGGLFAYATMDGEIGLVDVSNGALLRILSTPIDFSTDGSMAGLTRDFVVCSESDEGWASRPTAFHVWDLKAIMNQPRERVELWPICKFETFTSNVENFEVDDLGIVAIMEDDSAKGIQVLSFLPACSHCKRLTKPALLKKCGWCKSATYCSGECQISDWYPHHEAICSTIKPVKRVFLNCLAGSLVALYVLPFVLFRTLQF